MAESWAKYYSSNLGYPMGYTSGSNNYNDNYYWPQGRQGSVINQPELNHGSTSKTRVWTETKTPDGKKTYYFDTENGESTWTRPYGDNVQIISQDEWLAKQRMKQTEVNPPAYQLQSYLNYNVNSMATQAGSTVPFPQNEVTAKANFNEAAKSSFTNSVSSVPYKSLSASFPNTSQLTSMPLEQLALFLIRPDILWEAFEWSGYLAPCGRAYYFNTKTQTCIWEKPAVLSDFEAAKAQAYEIAGINPKRSMQEAPKSTEEKLRPDSVVVGILSTEIPTSDVNIKEETAEKQWIPIPSNVQNCTDAVESDTNGLKKDRKVSHKIHIPDSPWYLVWTDDCRMFYYNKLFKKSYWRKPDDLQGRKDVDKRIRIGIDHFRKSKQSEENKVIESRTSPDKGAQKVEATSTSRETKITKEVPHCPPNETTKETEGTKYVTTPSNEEPNEPPKISKIDLYDVNTVKGVTTEVDVSEPPKIAKIVLPDVNTVNDVKAEVEVSEPPKIAKIDLYDVKTVKGVTTEVDLSEPPKIAKIVLPDVNTVNDVKAEVEVSEPPKIAKIDLPDVSTIKGVKAEVDMSKVRANIPFEERWKRFKQMLADKKISAQSTWQRQLSLIVFDPRYLLLESSDRKNAFSEYVNELKE